MRVTDEELAELNRLRGRRDHAAFMIGVATTEWRQHVTSAEAVIAESRDVEQHVGPQILRAHGLDPDAGEYRIQPDGEIVELRDGAYVPVGER